MNPLRMRLPAVPLALVASCAATHAGLARQVPADTVVVLPAVEVRATRIATPPALVASSLTVLPRGPIERATEPALSLADAVRGVPGLEVESRGHLALGERISIRGMGGRAAFGVRGVQVLLDGIPLTLPDGQAVTEIVEPALLRSAEIVRGPSGHLWGNGSGGVVSLRTAATGTEPDGGSVRIAGGSYGTIHALAEAVSSPGRSRVHVYGSHLRTTGYREHSAGRLTRGGANAVVPVGAGTVLRFGALGVHQDVEAPGSLSSYDSGPRAADARYVETASGKRSTQVLGIVRLVTAAAGGVLETDLHGGKRDLENPLPFAWIGVDRATAGLRAGWQRSSGRLTVRVGTDLALQRDDRINADNVAGTAGDAIDVDQVETVRSAALSGAAVFTPGPYLSLTAGLRWDRIGMRLEDRLVLEDDLSGERTFDAVSPAISIRWSGPNWTTYVGWSTAFDTPTTTELVNSPDGSSAFNPDVGPQRTRGVETGFRAAGPDWFLDVALYSLRVRDLLTSFQDEASGRTYYANADRVVHRGFEGAYEWTPSDRIRVSLSGSIRLLRFESGAYDGNDIPGLPRRRMELEVETGTGSIRALLRLAATDDRYGDDANTSRIEGFRVVDVRLFHRGIDAGGAVLRPFVEVGNVFDEIHSGSIVVNARGGRYLEPSPDRRLTAGLSARFGAR